MALNPPDASASYDPAPTAPEPVYAPALPSPYASASVSGAALQGTVAGFVLIRDNGSAELRPTAQIESSGTNIWYDVTPAGIATIRVGAIGTASMADTASFILGPLTGASIDTKSQATGSARILSIRNSGTEVVYFTSDGKMILSGGASFASLGGDAYITPNTNTPALITSRVVGNTSMSPLLVDGQTADGASAVGVVLNNVSALATAGSKIISIRNNSVEKAYIDSQGAVAAAYFQATASLAPLIQRATGTTGEIQLQTNNGVVALRTVGFNNARVIFGPGSDSNLANSQFYGVSDFYPFANNSGVVNLSVNSTGVQTTGIGSFPSQTFVLTSSITGVNTTGVLIDIPNAMTGKALLIRTSGAALFAITRNNTIEMTNGPVFYSQGTWGPVFQSNVGSFALSYNGLGDNYFGATVGPSNWKSQVTSSAAAVAHMFTNSASLAIAGAKIVSFYSDNGATERAFIAATGTLVASGVRVLSTGAAYVMVHSTDNGGTAGFRFQGSGDRGSVYGDANYYIWVEPNAQYGQAHTIIWPKSGSVTQGGTGSVGVNVIPDGSSSIHTVYRGIDSSTATAILIGTGFSIVSGTKLATFKNSTVTKLTIDGSGTIDTSGSVKLDQVLHLAPFSNSSPTSGDFWFDGVNLLFRSGTTTRTMSWV